MNSPIRVESEIGKLKTVILKRPGLEIENLTPEYLTELLFEDIPYLPKIQEEHDYFAKVLRDQGAEVLYLENLVTESIKDDTKKAELVDSVLKESSQLFGYTLEKVRDYLLSFPAGEMVARIMAGVRKDAIKISKQKSLLSVAMEYAFYISPMPNLYFTRDPAASIGSGVSISNMHEPARRKESLFIKFILANHDRFREANIPLWIDDDFRFSIEGGDICILSKDVVAIGMSSRTTIAAIEHVTRNLFAKHAGVEKILAVDIPKTRAFMHLDTVFTMMDKDKFNIHPRILNNQGEVNSYVLERGAEPGHIKISVRRNISETLREVLSIDDIEFIACGAGDIIAAPREQWADGTNTFAVSPGVVISYDRNYVSNKNLRDHGVEVIEIMSSELSRGRGGPRCMTMPLYRESI